jgi:outer membrane protein assembly factor BamB
VAWHVREAGWLIVPAYDSNRVYFGTQDHRVVAVDRVSGAVRWQANTGNTASAVTAGKNLLVVGNVVVLGDVDLYAFDRGTGALRWTFRPNDFDAPGGHRFCADSSTIYASSFYGFVYAVDAQSGALRWTAQVPGGPERTATSDPVVSDGVVFVGVWHETHPLTGGLAALDAASGDVLWVHEFTPVAATHDSYSLGGAAIYGSLVIASAADGRVYGLDRASGDVRWVAPGVDGYPYNDLRGLALAGSTVVLSSWSGTAQGLDAATGAVRWSTPLSLASMSTDVATDGRIALFSTSEVIAVDVATGAIAWRTGTVPGRGGGYFGDPAIDGVRVYANRSDGFVALWAY